MQPFRLELPTGLPVGTVNAYLFTDPEPVLVDTGVAGQASWDALVSGLGEHGVSVTDLRRVIITHAHIDHFGQAGTIAELSDAGIWICDLGAPWLQAPDEVWLQRGRFYSETFLPALGLSDAVASAILSGIQSLEGLGGPIPPGRLQTFAKDSILEMGGQSWQVLHTPGHASMQTCFYEPQQKILLAADMLLETTPTPVVESPLDGTGDRVPALPLFMQSLDLVEALDLELVLPGHGRPFSDHRDLIQRQRQRILTRSQECLGWINSGVHTVAGLLDKMYGHQPSAFRFAGLWMLIGYLDLLEAEGAIEQQTRDGIWQYYAGPGK